MLLLSVTVAIINPRWASGCRIFFVRIWMFAGIPIKVCCVVISAVGVVGGGVLISAGPWGLGQRSAWHILQGHLISKHRSFWKDKHILISMLIFLIVYFCPVLGFQLMSCWVNCNRNWLRHLINADIYADILVPEFTENTTSYITPPGEWSKNNNYCWYYWPY